MFFLDDVKEKILELKNNGLNNEEISIALVKQGIKLKPFMIEEIYKGMNINDTHKKDSEKLNEKNTSIEQTNSQSDNNEKLGKSIQDIIFELRENGKTFQEIRIYLLEQLKISRSISYIRVTYINACKEKQKNPYRKLKKIKSDNAPKTSHKKKYLIPISNNEIFEKREEGRTYQEIADYFKGKGIHVTRETIRSRCATIYKEKGVDEPTAKYKRKFVRAIDKIPEDEIYTLKEQGLTYKQIANYYCEKGINISENLISEKCHNIYVKLGKKVKRAYAKEKIIIPIEEIIELREKRLSYKEISKYFKEKGIEVSLCTIQARCKEYYKKVGRKEPIARRIIDPDKKMKPVIPITGEEVFLLREKGLSYEQIREYFMQQGIKTSKRTVERRYKNFCKKRGIDNARIQENTVHSDNKNELDAKSVTELNNELNGLISKKQDSEKLLEEYSDYKDSLTASKEEKEEQHK